MARGSFLPKDSVQKQLNSLGNLGLIDTQIVYFPNSSFFSIIVDKLKKHDDTVAWHKSNSAISHPTGKKKPMNLDCMTCVGTCQNGYKIGH